MKKERIHAFSFMRFVCCMGVLIYHFFDLLPAEKGLLYPVQSATAGNWGDALVVVFLMLSGASLYYGYGDSWTLRRTGSFWWRRWKSIIPMYLLTYAYFEFTNMLGQRSALYRGEPWRYVFTLFGLDGYLSQYTETYYIMGEWFTGAILILYLLFPVLMSCFRRASLPTLGVSAALCCAVLIVSGAPYAGFWPITVCVFCMLLGMAFMKYGRALLNRWSLLVSLVGFPLLLFVEFSLPRIVEGLLMGPMLYVLLYYLGSWLCRRQVLARVLNELGGLSYGVFLMHHVTILQLFDYLPPQTTRHAVILLIMTVALTFIRAKILALTSQTLLAFLGRLFSRRPKQAQRPQGG